MRKLLLFIFILCVGAYAQNDTCFVFVDYQGKEYEYMFKSVDIANQYLAMTFDTTHGSYSADFTLLINYNEEIDNKFEGHLKKKMHPLWKDKVWVIGDGYGPKIKKLKKDKKDKKDKP